MLVSKGRVRPADAVAAVELDSRRMDQLGTTNQLESFRAHVTDHQLAAIVEDPGLVAVTDDVSRCPVGLERRGLVFPDLLAGVGIQALQSSIVVGAVKMVADDTG